MDFEALRLAIDDLIGSHGDDYPKGRQYMEQRNSLERDVEMQLSELDGPDPKRRLAATRRLSPLLLQFNKLKEEALLANPLIEFDQLLMVRRTPHGDPRRAMGRACLRV